MSPAEVARAVRLRLAAELETDRASLIALATSIASLRAETAGPETTRALALAFQLERYYTAIESVLRRALTALDGHVPGGADGHQELLRAAAVPIDGVRPALVPPDALPLLRELPGFRHYARHGYDVAPNARRLDELAVIAGKVHGKIAPALDAFAAALRAG